MSYNEHVYLHIHFNMLYTFFAEYVARGVCFCVFLSDFVFLVMYFSFLVLLKH